MFLETDLQKPIDFLLFWETDLQKSIDFLLNPFFVFLNDLYVDLLCYNVHMLLYKNEIKV